MAAIDIHYAMVVGYATELLTKVGCDFLIELLAAISFGHSNLVLGLHSLLKISLRIVRIALEKNLCVHLRCFKKLIASSKDVV
jgi:hypothetical protein